jgi:hypothetical protein
MKKGIELRLVAIGNRVNNNQINILTGGSEDIVVETSETQQPTDVAGRLRDKIAKGMLRVCMIHILRDYPNPSTNGDTAFILTTTLTSM